MYDCAYSNVNFYNKKTRHIVGQTTGKQAGNKFQNRLLDKK
jgi:hypothetical protein